MNTWLNTLFEKKLTMSEFCYEMKKRNISVITPGSLFLAVYKTDNSRLFIQMDEEGRVINGYFG